MYKRSLRGLLHLSVLVFCLMGVSIAEVATLSSDQNWGGGDVAGSALIGRTYNAGKGPGIWIVADGGYRLYLNGELLAQDNQAGRVTFVPMTFLPGTNAISIAGFDTDGAPGILVQIDELDKTYVSDSQWKVSTSPSDPSWKNKDFNDGSWNTATTAGNAASLPHGESLSDFATNSQAQWIWSANSEDKQALLRFSFDIKAEGFGEATTGGEGGNRVVASDWSAVQKALQNDETTIILMPEGTYDFRNPRNAVTEAIAQNRTWCKRSCGSNDANSTNTHYRVTFEANSCSSLQDGSSIVSESEGLMRWDRWITAHANKSLIGMGRGAYLRGASLFMRKNEGGENNIYRNLAIYDVNPHLVEGMDGLSVVGNASDFTSKYWADHISYKWISDGLDLENLTQGTISYLDFDGANSYNCWATDPYMHLAQDLEVTYANNYWHNTFGRVPKVTSKYGASKVHIYNSYVDYNYYFIVGASGSSASAYSQVLYENNYITGARSRLTDKSDYGSIHWTGNTVVNSQAKYYSNGSAGTVPPTDNVFTPPYNYSKRTLSNLPTEIPHYAGVGGPWGNMPEYERPFGLSNQAPSVQLTGPLSTDTLEAPASISLKANASDQDGNISRVDFFLGNTLVGTAYASPWNITITDVSSGVYSIIAKATDNAGLIGTSDFVTLSVSGKQTSIITTAPALQTSPSIYQIYNSQGESIFKGPQLPRQLPHGLSIVIERNTQGAVLHRQTLFTP